MNHFWSDRIQSIGTLDTSRKLRFSDRFQNAYTELFRLEEGARILEIGCGTGALCRALKRWYPSAEVVGLDRDDAFIDYAKGTRARRIGRATRPRCRSRTEALT